MENAKMETEKVNTHIVAEPAIPMTRMERFKKCGISCCYSLKENLLLVLLLGAVLAGCGVGFAVRSSGRMGKREIMYLQFPGEMLMRMLRMLILPLIVSSLISGIAGLDAKTCGRMGLRTIAYFATTTILAVVLGIIMAVTIQPGYNASLDKMARYGSAQRVNSIDTFLDLIR